MSVRYDIRKAVRNTPIEVAIIGAGPYGLSIAAHLQAAGVPFRIFGKPMHSWVAHMPKGMLLKSEGFASNLYDPNGHFTLKRFCAERGLPYAHAGLPVSLETFAAYGLAFQERLLPGLQRKTLTSLDRDENSFLLQFDDGELALAKKVVLAVGIAEFGRLPSQLAHLPAEFLSHSSRHADLQPFKGRRVAVIGGGSSAIDFADLLNVSGALVQLVPRRPALRFHNPPTGKPRTRWQNIRYPMTGMGPGLRARLYADAPLIYHFLPQRVRHNIIQDFAPPEGGWFSKERVMGRVPTLLAHSPVGAEIKRGEVHLQLLRPDGSEHRLVIDHVIAATGYRVDLAKLKFLSSAIQSHLKQAYQLPLLSTQFESSVPGLYFVGLPSTLSFGPMFRFALGAGFTARRLAGALKSVPARGHQRVMTRVAAS